MNKFRAVTLVFLDMEAVLKSKKSLYWVIEQSANVCSFIYYLGFIPNTLPKSWGCAQHANINLLISRVIDTLFIVLESCLIDMVHLL